MKITIRAYKNLGEYITEQTSRQINSLNDDINAFKKMLSGKDLSDREKEWLNEAIAEKKEFIKKQKDILKKYSDKIRASVETAPFAKKKSFLAKI